MSIRIRIVNGITIAICAARSVAKDGDIYLDDTVHHALTDKFGRDFEEEGYGTFPSEHDDLVGVEESNNSARDWWDKTYVY